MFYNVYVLLSLKDEKLYVGLTTNLKKRIYQHNEGEVTSTKCRRPLILLYFETYCNLEDAENREKYLKGGGRARRNIRIQLKYSIENKIKLKL